MYKFTYRLSFLALLASVLSFAAAAQTKALETKNMDTKVSACTDFFEFANGAWLRSTQIPASESRYGTFNILADNNNDILKDILDKASAEKTAAKGSDIQLIGDFYASCMDEAGIDKLGSKPIQPFLKRINKIKDLDSLRSELAFLHNSGVPGLFGLRGGTDLKDSNMVIVNAGQGGLSLPNRDYYTKDDAKSVETREKFVEYMVKIFGLLGDKPDAAKANAATVMRIQTQLAEHSLAPAEMRDPDTRYHKMTVEKAQELTPNFDWAKYMNERGVPKTTEFNIGQPAFFENMNAMLKDVSINDWKTYLRWMTVNSAASSLSAPFADANFDFFGRYLSGAKEKQPRWKTCVEATDRTLGEALGMQYVERTFKPEAKARMDELISNLFVALKSRIDGLEWMSDATKVQAQKKLSTFKRKIGYPDVLRGYKGLSLDRKSYAGNVLAARKFQTMRNLEDINKAPDRTRWGFSPPTVNASYSSTNNEITFPAGILQPPFFNVNADDAINYGAIGGVIGHEITHGFDDSGSRFDADGNLKMWWTPEDRKKFDERAACVIKQFNGYEVQPNLFINGKLTLGENIGDFAGLTVAYDAFMRSMEGKPRPANIDGFTPEQRFFLGWAQVWKGKYTPEAEELQVKTNSHSLPRWRVNGPLSNMPQFKEAFNCNAGDAMVRDDQCAIW